MKAELVTREEKVRQIRYERQNTFHKGGAHGTEKAGTPRGYYLYQHVQESNPEQQHTETTKKEP
jgi:hypothetical protein